MDEIYLSSLRAILIQRTLEYVLENSNISEMQAIEQFYKSKVYSELTREGSDLWHYSPRLLYTLYQDELLTGSFEYPQV